MSDKLIIKGVTDFDARHIFDCGQCFRWREEDDGSWTGIVTTIGQGTRMANVSFVPGEEGKSAKPKAKSGDEGKRAKTAAKSGDVVIREYTKNSTKESGESFWFNYLDLGRDYKKIKSKLSRGDDVMKRAIKAGGGIRILNQDLWETIVSFIISQNNNIPRIKGCIERLSELFGEPIKLSDEGKKLVREGNENYKIPLLPYSVPGPEKLAKLSVDDLAPVRLGYRAKYLIAAAEEVLARGMPTTYEEVLALTGVGPKVANCIGLFGLHETNSFPIDVWVKRVMNRLYDFDEEDIKGMEEFALKNFGELSGFAQQYLFYYIREHSESIQLV